MPTAGLSRLIVLTPLLGLALCACLTRPAGAQGIPPPIPGLTYDAAGNIYLYTDPITGYMYGPDPNLTYAANPGSSTVVTSSYIYDTQYVNTDISQADHTYSTTLDALLNGQTVFDMTFNAAYADPAVQAAVAQADALLAAGGASPAAPSLTSSLLTSLGSQTTTVKTGETNDGTGTRGDGSPIGVITTTTSYGPGTIGPVNGVPGDATLIDPLHPIYFYVLAGQTDVNVTDTVTFTISQNVTTTTTDLLTQRYVITGTPNATGAAVPEPSPWPCWPWACCRWESCCGRRPPPSPTPIPNNAPNSGGTGKVIGRGKVPRLPTEPGRYLL